MAMDGRLLLLLHVLALLLLAVVVAAGGGAVVGRDSAVLQLRELQWGSSGQVRYSQSKRFEKKMTGNYKLLLPPFHIINCLIFFLSQNSFDLSKFIVKLVTFTTPN